MVKTTTIKAGINRVLKNIGSLNRISDTIGYEKGKYTYELNSFPKQKEIDALKIQFPSISISPRTWRISVVVVDDIFTPVFIIFKEGTTAQPVTILKKEGEPFDENAKRAKYIMLGYTITEVKEVQS